MRGNRVGGHGAGGGCGERMITSTKILVGHIAEKRRCIYATLRPGVLLRICCRVRNDSVSASSIYTRIPDCYIMIEKSKHFDSRFRNDLLECLWLQAPLAFRSLQIE